MDDAPASDESAEAEQPVLSTPPVPEAAFTMIENLLAMIAHPGEFKKRLRGLHTALAAVDDGMARLEADRAAFVEHERSVRAELAEQAAAIDRRRVVVHTAEVDLQVREERVADRLADISRQDAFVRRRAMVIAKLELNDRHLDSGLVDLPTWRQLVEALLEVEPPADPEFRLETRRPADAAAGTTVMQTVYKRSMRRVAQAEI